MYMGWPFSVIFSDIYMTIMSHINYLDQVNSGKNSGELGMAHFTE